jgi:GTP pyrophosphokinase
MESFSQTPENYDEAQREALVMDAFHSFYSLLKADTRFTEDNLREIERAFLFAKAAHHGVIRKSGEPYIMHPLAVAEIIYKEMGQATTSIICSFLHDVLEDTLITSEEMNSHFGPTVTQIVEGLTKVEKMEYNNLEDASIQLETYRKIMMTISEDLRVLAVKIADRLHNMRTLEFQKPNKRLKISSETLYLYAPLAHRIGFYKIKNELEDISLKHTDPEEYHKISQKLETTKEDAEEFIQSFIAAIRPLIDPLGLKYSIKSRFKSIYAIYNKIHKKGVTFEEIKDLYAIRIILDTRLEKEHEDCYAISHAISEKYPPDESRIRDWLKNPKTNGYESLHITVAFENKDVEVQIRTEEMDKRAEKGASSHWIYKSEGNHGNVELNPREKQDEQYFMDFINEIQEVLHNPEYNATEAVQIVRAAIRPATVYVFTPKNQIIALPTDATILDFAYTIHSKIGNYAMSAKVNGQLVNLNHILKTGDRVEVIASQNTQKVKVKEEWLSWAITLKAQNHIREALKMQRRKGKEIYERALRLLSVREYPKLKEELTVYFGLETEEQLYYKLVQTEEEELKENLSLFISAKKGGKVFQRAVIDEEEEKVQEEVLLVLGINEKIKPKLAYCCNPVPGQPIVGIQLKNRIWVHLTTCPRATAMMAEHGDKIVTVKFPENQNDISFLTALRLQGRDRANLLLDVMTAISKLDLNLRKVTINAENGWFEGLFLVYVKNVEVLNTLIHLLSGVPSVESVSRTDSRFRPFEK